MMGPLAGTPARRWRTRTRRRRLPWVSIARRRTPPHPPSGPAWVGLASFAAAGERRRMGRGQGSEGWAEVSQLSARQQQERSHTGPVRRQAPEGDHRPSQSKASLLNDSPARPRTGPLGSGLSISCMVSRRHRRDELWKTGEDREGRGGKRPNGDRSANERLQAPPVLGDHIDRDECSPFTRATRGRRCLQARGVWVSS